MLGPLTPLIFVAAQYGLPVVSFGLLATGHALAGGLTIAPWVAGFVLVKLHQRRQHEEYRQFREEADAERREKLRREQDVSTN